MASSENEPPHDIGDTIVVDHSISTLTPSSRKLAKPTEAFKAFAEEFYLFAKMSCSFHNNFEFTPGAKTRTTLRKIGASAVDPTSGAPTGSHVLAFVETTSIKYLPVPVPQNLNATAVTATGLVNEMRTAASSTEKTIWRVTFSPALNGDGDDWRFEYADIESDDRTHARLTEQEWIKAVMRMRLDCGAQYELGIWYDHGQGVKQDDARAVHWYQKAASQSVPSAFMAHYSLMPKMFVNGSAAKCNLADKYENGRGIERDMERALYWYRCAADQENEVAEYSLGMMYKNGVGVERDLETAAMWFRRSAERFYAPAREELRKLAQLGEAP